ERLPCPWCGGAETGITYNTVECSTCGAEGPPVMDGDDERMPTNAEVIAAWNRRTPPVAAVNAELLDSLHGLLNVLPSATTHPAIKAARVAIARAEAGTPSHPRFRHRRTGDT